MNLSLLVKQQARSKKRVGRGIGSGKGKTSTRGTKGQKARGTVPQSFIGGSLPLYKKLPFRRGWGNAKSGAHLIPLSLEKLISFKDNTEVDLTALISNGLITKNDGRKGIKLVGSADLKSKLSVKLPVTRSARVSIEKAGGTVI